MSGLQLLAQAAMEALAVHEAGVIVAANAAFAEMVGRPGDHLAGQRVCDLVPPEIVREFDDCIREAAGPVELAWRASDGSRSPVQVRCHPHPDTGRDLSVISIRPVNETPGRNEPVGQEHHDLVEAQVSLGSWEYYPETGEGRWSRELYQLFYVDPGAGVPAWGEFARLIHPDDRERTEEAMRQRSAGDPVPVEYRTNPELGPVRYLTSTAQPIRNASGTIVRLTGTVRDVTDSKRSAQALQEREERWRSLFEIAPVGIRLADLTGRIVAVNDAFLDQSGFGREEVLQLSTPSLFARPEDRARLLALAAKQGTVRRHAVMLKRKDGSTYEAEVSLSLLTLDGHPHTLAILEDVTERQAALHALKESETRFRALMENGRDVIVMFDGEGMVRYVSPSVTRVLGYEPDQLVGRPGVEIVHPDDLEGAMAVFADALNQPDATLQATHRLRHADGTYRTVSVSGQNLLAHPSVRAMVSSFHDVTGQIHLEDLLRQAQKMEAIGQLTGGIAHDFNNMLTTIIGGVDILELRLPADAHESRRDLQQVRRAALRGAEMIRKLLAFSRKEGLRFEAVDLHHLCQDTAQMLMRVLPETVEMIVDTQPDSAIAHADRGALQQILVNLATNARDAMPDGGTLTITARSVPHEEIGDEVPGAVNSGPMALLQVSDTGMGMDAVTLERVFDPFFTTKPTGEGTGLGMAMVYGLVKQQGGQVRISSVPGSRTTVSVFLNVSTSRAEVVELLAGETSSGGTETILVVEDNHQVRDLAARILTNAGYRVLEAEDGRTGLDIMMNNEGIDLVVTDVVMPRLGGRGLFQQARAHGLQARFVFTSGYSELTHGAGADPPGGGEWLRKPWSPAELLAHVRRNLD